MLSPDDTDMEWKPQRRVKVSRADTGEPAVAFEQKTTIQEGRTSSWNETKVKITCWLPESCSKVAIKENCFISERLSGEQ